MRIPRYQSVSLLFIWTNCFRKLCSSVFFGCCICFCSQDHGGSNHSAKVEPANGCTGKRETGKSAKKPDKGRTAKEEARELQLREEESIRESRNRQLPELVECLLFVFN
ncbi:hypothetical protein ACE6H2_011891 [Prunus campanulata]